MALPRLVPFFTLSINSASIGVLGLFVLTGSLLGQERLKPNQPGYSPPPPLERPVFQDLLPPGPRLDLQKGDSAEFGALDSLEKDRVLQNRDFRRRYLEGQWQHLSEEKNDILLLEQALLDQFGSHGFSAEMGQHSYHESPQRRFQIVFLLSLPFTALYAYGLFSLVNVLANGPGANLNIASSVGALGLGMGLSAWIGWYDHRQSKEYKSSPDNWLETNRPASFRLGIEEPF